MMVWMSSVFSFTLFNTKLVTIKIDRRPNHPTLNSHSTLSLYKINVYLIDM